MRKKRAKLKGCVQRCASTAVIRCLIISILCLVGLTRVIADQPRITREQAEALVASLRPQQGSIVLHDGLAALQVPAGFHFFNGADSNTVLVKLWGNPPQPNPLGMLMPAAASPLSEDSWAVIITYEDDGYVKDEDAEKINYSDLLAEMQKGTESANAERVKTGYPAIHLVGWAKAPRYDQQSHKLYWAKELKFGQSTQNTLNYDIRMLGRGGVLVLSAVASMAQLPMIEQATPGILSAIEFNPGDRYSEFNPREDKIASYGLAALVAGGVAAKLGFFKGIWIAILAAKKFIIIGVVAITAWVRKLFKRSEPSASDVQPGV